MDYRIISIGALSVHELWPTQGEARTAHATTTLVRTAAKTILVDPGLPPQVIAARLAERAGLRTTDITDVFLTCFRPAHRWGLGAFGEAKWWVAEAEREALGGALVEAFDNEQDEQAREQLRLDIAVLKRCKAAPDTLAQGVDLFPLPGFSPGGCGLLLSHPQSTTLIAGDAVATIEHLEQGRVLRGASDIEQAQESLLEAVEIADVIVPGHDNMTLNRTRRPY